MIRKFLIVLGWLMVILIVAMGFGGYYAYQHRQELTQKAIDYAMQNMGGTLLSRNAAKISDKPAGLENIIGLLAGDGANNIDLSGLAQQALSSLGNLHTNENVSVNDINARDKRGRTLLMNVCRTDASPQVIKMLLQYGADVNASDAKGRTALMYAVALNQNPQVIDLLVADGADFSAHDLSGKAVIDYAATDELRTLLQKYLP